METPDHFRSHLIALLSVYSLGPSTAPLPKYNGPTDWQTDSILRSLAQFSARMYAAESVAHRVNKQEHRPDSRPSTTVQETDAEFPSKARSLGPTSINLNDLRTSHESSSFFGENFLGVPVEGATTSSAPPTSSLEYVLCPRCGTRATDPRTIHKISSFSTPISSGSPSVVAIGGPLDIAARVSGMSAVEELKLLKDQVQDVARVCNAVANGDLSQKITVDVRGEVMVKLKDAINTMVRLCLLFAYPSHSLVILVRLKNLVNLPRKLLVFLKKSERKGVYRSSLLNLLTNLRLGNLVAKLSSQGSKAHGRNLRTSLMSSRVILPVKSGLLLKSLKPSPLEIFLNRSRSTRGARFWI